MGPRRVSRCSNKYSVQPASDTQEPRSQFIRPRVTMLAFFFRLPYVCNSRTDIPPLVHELFDEPHEGCYAIVKWQMAKPDPTIPRTFSASKTKPKRHCNMFSCCCFKKRSALLLPASALFSLMG